MFGSLKGKLNRCASKGKCVMSLILAIMMLLPLFSSFIFAETYETEIGTSAETGYDTAAASEESVTEVPVADEPDTDAPETQIPVPETPDTVEPDTEAPVTDAPETQIPVPETPDTEAPAADEPGTEAPVTDDPVELTPVELTVDIDGSDYAVISGVLPEDGSVTVAPARIPRGSETTFSAYDLTVYDGEGEEYFPEDDLTVELHSDKIADTLAEGNSVGVLEKNRYGYFQAAQTVSVSGDSVKFMADDNSTYYLYANQLVKTLVASDGNTYRITVLYDGKAGFPEDAEIRAEEVSVDAGNYRTYLENTASTLGVELSSLTYNKLFDIAIVDAAGTEYQPNDSVRVTVELMENEAESVEDLRVVHFGEKDDPVELDASTSGNAVTFETNGFSIFSLNDTSIASRVINAIFGDNKLYENDDIILTGRMPLFGTVEATPVQVQIDGRDALVAYDIKIYANSIMKLLGIPWQPSEGAVRVTVKSDAFADAEGSLSVYHLQDEYSEPDFVASVNAVDSSVTFEAGGFSAYAIVPGIGGLEGEWITNSNELKSLIGQDDDPKGFYLAYKYPGNITYFRSSLNGNSAFNETINNGQAAVWYFESAGADNQYRIYTVIGGENRYMRNTSGNNMGLTANVGSAAVFELSDAADYKFYFKILGENKWLQHSNSGNGIRLWTDNGNAVNSRLSICYLPSSSSDGDPYGIDGKTYGLMSWQGGTAGKALMAEQSAGTGNLEAKELTVMVKRENGTEDRLFVPNDADITMWTFHWAQDGYTLSADLNGSTVYLCVTSSGLALVSDPNAPGCKLDITPGTGINEGRLCLRAGNDTVTYFDIDTGFGVNGAAGSEWLYLVQLSELTADYVRTYSARKVGVSDSEIKNGTPIVVYARVWDDNEKKYKFYAIDHEGSLFPVYDELDTIEWVGSQLNSFQWNFVEYYWEGTNDPNGYFELYNPYGNVYIAPQVTDGQILSADTIGVNMPGRTEGYYQTTILAWDDANYAYAGLKVENGRLVSCPLDEADDFYFAILQDLPVDDVLSTVPTVDHTQYGITMTITDFNATGNGINQNPMSKFLNSGAGGAVSTTVNNLLSSDLKANGYPDAHGGSLLSLLESAGNMREINHLFIQSTYNGEGYFEFDSSENFAHLEDDNNFTVYRQLGSTDLNDRPTLKHGQFFPFDMIRPGTFTSVNRQNLYSATAQLLDDSNPRKYEQLYLVPQPDYYFALTLEASFTQTANGKDSWGHDIIYEFTGDDDFWLYVDGERVIDLGGIHSALAGSVNFATGDVYVNGKYTTLYKLFYDNYKGRGHTDADARAYVDGIFENKDGHWVFKDNTTHTMKIFYMERGAGASNLHMRFNLASIKPGTVELSKTLSQENSDEDLTGSVYAEYLYQVYYRRGSVGAVDLSAALSGTPTDTVTWGSANGQIATVNEHGQVTAIGPGSVTVTAEYDGVTEQFLVEIKQINGTSYVNVYKDGEILPQYLDPTEHLLGDVDGEADLVKYKNSKTSVAYHDTFTIPRTDISYDNVFLLKPGEVAVITLPETASVYRIVECGVNQNVYSKVSVNDTELVGNAVTGHDNNDPPGTVTRWDYATDYTTSEKVARVLYDNEVRELRDLTVTKRLFDVNGNDISASGENAEFNFRVYLATEYDNDVTGTPANMQAYYVKDISGNYCTWDAAGQTFISLGKSDFDLLTDAEKSAATFNTSMNGSVSKILAGYSVEFRNLLPGTQYRIEERPGEIPDGYSFKEYQKDATALLVDRSGVPGVVDFMHPGVDASVLIDNYKGFGLRVNKTWTDAVFMRSRAPVYFAVFTVSGDTLTMVPDSARQLIYGDTQSVYWYYEALPVQTDFGDYVVREISPDNPSVDPETGIVTYTDYTVFDDADSITLQGQQTDDSADAPYQYTVLYGDAVTSVDSNVRVFPVTNDRPSITLRKTDWNGNALAGAEFTLIDGANNFIGEFTSDSDGLITLVFLGSNKTYYLIETDSPQGYCAMEGSMSIAVAGNNVTVSGVSPDCYTLDQSAEPPVLTIKNRPYVFNVVKVGKQPDGTTVPQEGVHFELHKKKTVGGATNYDVNPEPGFDDLITRADGTVPGLDNTLAPGDYELREKAPLAGYYGLESYIYFTVSETGVITFGSHPEEASMTAEINASTGAKEYTVTIINRLIPPAPTGFAAYVVPFVITGLLGTALFALIRIGRKRRRGGDSV